MLSVSPETSCRAAAIAILIAAWPFFESLSYKAAAFADDSQTIQSRTTYRIEDADLQGLRERNDQINRILLENLRLIRKNPAFSRLSARSKVVGFTYRFNPDSSAYVREIIVIDGDLVLIGCEQDPPGVSCMGPCPCEGTPQPQ